MTQSHKWTPGLTRTFVRLVRLVPRVKRYARIGSDVVACSGAPFRVCVSLSPIPPAATHAQGVLSCVRALLWVARDAPQHADGLAQVPLRVRVSSRGA